MEWETVTFSKDPWDSFMRKMHVAKCIDTATSILGAQETFGLCPSSYLCSAVEVAMDVALGKVRHCYLIQKNPGSSPFYKVIGGIC